MSTPILVTLIITAATLAGILAAVLVDHITNRHTPSTKASAALNGHDLIPAHVALVHDPQCRRCEVYDRRLDEGIDALEDLANGKRRAA